MEFLELPLTKLWFTMEIAPQLTYAGNKPFGLSAWIVVFAAASILLSQVCFSYENGSWSLHHTNPTLLPTTLFKHEQDLHHMFQPSNLICLASQKMDRVRTTLDTKSTAFLQIISIAHWFILQFPSFHKLSFVSLLAAIMSLGYSTIAIGIASHAGKPKNWPQKVGGQSTAYSSCCLWQGLQVGSNIYCPYT